MSTKIEKQLLSLCQKFILENEISCPENIYQSDRVILNSQEFIEKICELVGYAEVNED